MKRRTSRKKQVNAPLHLKRNMLHIHLSPELRKKLKKRSILVRKGDKVKVLRGSYKGKQGMVIEVDYKKTVLFVEGVSKVNSRGKDVFISIHPSNVMLIERKKEKEGELKRGD